MKKKNNTALYLSLTILALIWLVPIVTVFITSLKSNSDFFSGMGLFDLPEKLQWHNYSDAWSKGHLDRYIRNGLIVTCLKVPISVFISSLLAFALTRLHVRHARGIFIFVLIGMMLPQQAALIPLNIVYSRAGLTNTYYCLILTYLGFGIPLAKPAIASAVIMDFLYTWNEFMLQSVLITTDTMKTVPNGLLSFFGEFTVDYGLLNAGVLISILPVFLVYLIFQKYFVSGMAGAVKG